jgi:hypothetical protein
MFGINKKYDKLNARIDKLRKQLECSHENYIIEKRETFWGVWYRQICEDCGLELDAFQSDQKAARLKIEQAERDLEKAKRDKENATKEE